MLIVQRAVNMEKRLSEFTETIEGMIPHLIHPEYLFYMPVKLERRRTLAGRHKTVMIEDRNCETSYPVPMRISGQYVYALPGGGNFLSSRALA